MATWPVVEDIIPRGRLIWVLLRLWRGFDFLSRGCQSWLLGLLWRTRAGAGPCGPCNVPVVKKLKQKSFLGWKRAGWQPFEGLEELSAGSFKVFLRDWGRSSKGLSTQSVSLLWRWLEDILSRLDSLLLEDICPRVCQLNLLGRGLEDMLSIPGVGGSPTVEGPGCHPSKGMAELACCPPQFFFSCQGTWPRTQTDF